MTEEEIAAPLLNQHVPIKAPEQGELAISLGLGQDAEGKAKVVFLAEIPYGTIVLLIDDQQAEWAGQHLIDNAQQARAKNNLGVARKLYVPGT